MFGGDDRKLGSRRVRSFRPAWRRVIAAVRRISGEACGGSDPVPVCGADRPEVIAMPRAPFGFACPRDQPVESRLKPG